MLRIGVVGVGSIGSVLAQGFDQLGHQVVINDIDNETEEELPYPARGKKWIAANCDFAVFALPTPTDDHGGDAGAIDEALEAFHNANATIILRSTMPPGETRRLADKHDLPLVYSPEFLRDRSGVEDFFHPDRIVISGPKEQTMRAQRLFETPEIRCDNIILTDYLTAEIGKEAHNAYFATKVSFANQMRMLAEKGGADPQEVMDIITADSRNTTSHLDPMLGPFGGKCLPKDTRALEIFGRKQAADTTLLQGVLQTNAVAKDQYDNVEITGTYPNITVVAEDD